MAGQDHSLPRRLRELLRALSGGMRAGGYPPEVSRSQGRVAEVRRTIATSGHPLSRSETDRRRDEALPGTGDGPSPSDTTGDPHDKR